MRLLGFPIKVDLNFVLVGLVPLLGCDLTFANQFARGIHHAGLNDSEWLLGLHVAAHVALALLGVNVVGLFLEVDNGVHWVAVVYHIAALINNEQFVQKLIDVAIGLVDVYNDQLTLEHLTFEERHNLLGVRARETRCGFVHKEDRGFAHELQSNVESLALSAAEHLV